MDLKKPEAFVLISIFLVTLCVLVNPSSSDDSAVSMPTLSRKKRYLTFPSGSVLQVSLMKLKENVTDDQDIKKFKTRSGTLFLD
jgi:hypothetical protein